MAVLFRNSPSVVSTKLLHDIDVRSQGLTLLAPPLSRERGTGGESYPTQIKPHQQT
jgi:hypothetical protein